MKKLLALILCVVMVLSLAPAAFAAGAVGGTADGSKDTSAVYIGTAAAKKAVENIGKDINAMYTAITADQAVYGTAQSIYDMTNGLAKELLKDTEKMEIGGVDVYQDKLVENVRKGLNHVIGDEIRNYMADRTAVYLDSNNNIKPDKYLETYVKAVNKALSSEKGQANIQAIVYGLAALSVQKSVNDAADDLYTEMKDWGHLGEFGWTLADPSTNYQTTWQPNATSLIPTGASTLTSDATLASDIIAGNYNAP